MNTKGSSLVADTSTTMMRWWISTCVAERPMPAASYMVSNRSSTSLRVAAVTPSTGCALVRKRGSGNSRIGNSAMWPSSALGRP